MGTSVLPYRYRVNGLIDTSKTAIDNLELIGNSVATWITYDVQDGKWAVVINRAGSSVYSFGDNNIIGAIKLNGTGLVDQYNSVEVKFPHRDLNDQEDWVKIEIPAEDRLPNEPDNCLTMDLPVMNEPIQAQIIGLIELKQARLDKIITFQTDYSMINLQAGNIVDVTNSVYGWTNKLFRIIRMEETDVDGAIVIEFTALEYDANIYSLADLYRYTRTNADGILTQGALGKPTQPTVVKFEDDPNPRVEITTSTPDNTDPLNLTGIVESIEFWSSIDGTNYTLMSTQKPASALTYASNTSVTFVYNVIDTNFYVKCRCANSTTTGEFSNPTSVIFAPRQITDAINNDTKALDSSGNILNTLGLAGLMKLLDNLISGNNASAAGGIYDKYNQTYSAVNGTSLSGKAVMISNGIVSQQGLIAVPSGASFNTIWTSPTFPAIISGSYKLDVIVDQNTSGAEGAVGDIIQVTLQLRNVTDNITVVTLGSGGEGTWYWNDYAMTALVTLDSTKSYQYIFSVRNDVTTNPSSNANFDLGISLYTFVQ